MRAVLLLPTLAAACASSTGAARDTPAVAERLADEGPETVRIVDARYGREHSLRAEEMTLPFGPNQNGNELVVAALEQARERGAAYLGDLAITMTFRWGGTPIECRTQVRFERDPTHAAPGAAPAPILPPSAGPQYGTDVEKFRPAKVAFVAEDREINCVVDNGDERCGWKDVTRSAERYDYEGKVGFVPPNWTHLAERFAAGRLVPAEPSCYSIEESELKSGRPYRLSAVAFHRGPTARKPGVEVLHQGDGVQRYQPRSGDSTPASGRGARESNRPTPFHDPAKEIK